MALAWRFSMHSGTAAHHACSMAHLGYCMIICMSLMFLSSQFQLWERVRDLQADEARWILPRRYRDLGLSIPGDTARLRVALSKLITGVCLDCLRMEYVQKNLPNSMPCTMHWFGPCMSLTRGSNCIPKIAKVGQEFTLALVGGSVTEGHGGTPTHPSWGVALIQMISLAFNNTAGIIRLVNGARGASTSAYMSLC